MDLNKYKLFVDDRIKFLLRDEIPKKLSAMTEECYRHSFLFICTHLVGADIRLCSRDVNEVACYSYMSTYEELKSGLDYTTISDLTRIKFLTEFLAKRELGRDSRVFPIIITGKYPLQGRPLTSGAEAILILGFLYFGSSGDIIRYELIYDDMYVAPQLKSEKRITIVELPEATIILASAENKMKCTVKVMPLEEQE